MFRGFEAGTSLHCGVEWDESLSIDDNIANITDAGDHQFHGEGCTYSEPPWSYNDFIDESNFYGRILLADTDDNSFLKQYSDRLSLQLYKEKRLNIAGYADVRYWEETFYWWNELAEAHGWVHPDLIDEQGFKFYVYFGSQIKRIIPRNSSPYALTGYNLNDLQFLQNVAKIKMFIDFRLNKCCDLSISDNMITMHYGTKDLVDQRITRGPNVGDYRFKMGTSNTTYSGIHPILFTQNKFNFIESTGFNISGNNRTNLSAAAFHRNSIVNGGFFRSGLLNSAKYEHSEGVFLNGYIYDMEIAGISSSFDAVSFHDFPGPFYVFTEAIWDNDDLMIGINMLSSTKRIANLYLCNDGMKNGLNFDNFYNIFQQNINIVTDPVSITQGDLCDKRSNFLLGFYDQGGVFTRYNVYSAQTEDEISYIGGARGNNISELNNTFLTSGDYYIASAPDITYDTGNLLSVPETLTRFGAYRRKLLIHPALFGKLTLLGKGVDNSIPFFEETSKTNVIRGKNHSVKQKDLGIFPSNRFRSSPTFDFVQGVRIALGNVPTTSYPEDLRLSLQEELEFDSVDTSVYRNIRIASDNFGDRVTFGIDVKGIYGYETFVNSLSSMLNNFNNMKFGLININLTEDLTDSFWKSSTQFNRLWNVIKDRINSSQNTYNMRNFEQLNDISLFQFNIGSNEEFRGSIANLFFACNSLIQRTVGSTSKVGLIQSFSALTFPLRGFDLYNNFTETDFYQKFVDGSGYIPYDTPSNRTLRSATGAQGFGDLEYNKVCSHYVTADGSDTNIGTRPELRYNDFPFTSQYSHLVYGFFDGSNYSQWCAENGYSDNYKLFYVERIGEEIKDGRYTELTDMNDLLDQYCPDGKTHLFIACIPTEINPPSISTLASSIPSSTEVFKLKATRISDNVDVVLNSTSTQIANFTTETVVVQGESNTIKTSLQQFLYNLWGPDKENLCKDVYFGTKFLTSDKSWWMGTDGATKWAFPTASLFYIRDSSGSITGGTNIEDGEYRLLIPANFFNVDCTNTLYSDNSGLGYEMCLKRSLDNPLYPYPHSFNDDSYYFTRFLYDGSLNLGFSSSFSSNRYNSFDNLIF